jgi:EpsI family protein
MFSPSRLLRYWITAAVLLGAFVLLHTVSHGEALVLREPLRVLPSTLGIWSGQEHPLEARVVTALNVTDYTNRLYTQPAGEPVQLYIGYYATQKTGDTIHSPKNCLPGAGWNPIRSGYATILVAKDHQIIVNEYIIQQDLNKEMVFYWYQSGGRVIASEYSAKFWMVADAISRHRTDGALVRIISPTNDNEAEAHDRLVRFTQLLFPHLNAILPN